MQAFKLMQSLSKKLQSDNALAERDTPLRKDLNYQGLDSYDENLAPETQILVIDDSEFNLFAIASILSGMFQLPSDTANSGEKGLELIQARAKSGQPMYKLILLDFFIVPGWNGPETADQIKEFFTSNP